MACRAKDRILVLKPFLVGQEHIASGFEGGLEMNGVGQFQAPFFCTQNRSMPKDVTLYRNNFENLV